MSSSPGALFDEKQQHYLLHNWICKTGLKVYIYILTLCKLCWRSRYRRPCSWLGYELEAQGSLVRSLAAANISFPKSPGRMWDPAWLNLFPEINGGRRGCCRLLASWVNLVPSLGMGGNVPLLSIRFPACRQTNLPVFVCVYECVCVWLVVITVVAIKMSVIMTLQAADNSERSVYVYQSTPCHIL